MAGRVFVEGTRVDKAGFAVRRGSKIDILGSPNPYVSRGGLKLEGALIDFGLTVEDFLCIDVGASTGGFTDCLLHRGASRVYTIDVGKHLLDNSLREDPRVVVIEECNVRHVQPDFIPEKVDLITIDVSFISLSIVIPPVIPFLKRGGYLLALVKPQFELSRREVGRKGVVRDEKKRLKAVDNIINVLSNSGFCVEGLVKSRLKGPKGNQEYFVLSSLPGS